MSSDFEEQEGRILRCMQDKQLLEDENVRLREDNERLVRDKDRLMRENSGLKEVCANAMLDKDELLAKHEVTTREKECIIADLNARCRGAIREKENERIASNRLLSQHESTISDLDRRRRCAESLVAQSDERINHLRYMAIERDLMIRILEATIFKTWKTVHSYAPAYKPNALVYGVQQMEHHVDSVRALDFTQAPYFAAPPPTVLVQVSDPLNLYNNEEAARDALKRFHDGNFSYRTVDRNHNRGGGQEHYDNPTAGTYNFIQASVHTPPIDDGDSNVPPLTSDASSAPDDIASSNYTFTWRGHPDRGFDDE